MNRYLSVLRSWEDPQFVTLTVPNCNADELKGVMDKMIKCIAAVSRAVKRTHGAPFVVLRKLECTFSPTRGDFHPHLHMVVRGHRSAALAVDEWLKRNPTANRLGQDQRPCDGDGLKELFKYFTKLSTKQDGKTERIPAVALDVIFRAMKDKRAYQPMGFTVAAEDDDDDEAPIVLDEATAAADERPVAWEWSQPSHDWVDFSTGEALTGYQPGEAFEDFVGSLAPK
jgi:hypothetical protein